jgi:hypothetical protein
MAASREARWSGPAIVAAGPSSSPPSPSQEELVAAHLRQIRAIRTDRVGAANRDMQRLADRYPACRFTVRTGVADTPRSAGFGIDGAIEKLRQVEAAPLRFSTRTVRIDGRWAWFLLAVGCGDPSSGPTPLS